MQGSALQLHDHVDKLAGDIGERNVFCPAALHAAADYIQEQWQRQGYEVVAQTYDARGVESANLEVTCHGSELPNEMILIGAHYDTVLGCPGANDNASGVAALLELSRWFRDLTPRRSVRFVAFVNEESPFFYWEQMGSLIYAKAARRENIDIRLMISLEMLGSYSDEPGSQRYPPLFKYFYPDRADFIAFVSDLRSRKQLRSTVSAFRACSDFPVEYVSTFSFVPGISLSDHSSFWRQGYRALMVTDTAFYRYAYYHTQYDTPDKIDYERMARVTEGLRGAIETLATHEV